MRRFATLITTVALTISGLTFVPAQAEEPITILEACSTSGFFAVQGTTVVGSDNCEGDAFIPATITRIDNFAFVFASNLTSVTFQDPTADTPELTFGQGAFYNSGLVAIEIPRRATSIGTSAFGVIASLTSVTFKDPIADMPELTIGRAAFEEGGMGVVAIEIPRRATSIGDYAFRQANSLTSVTFRAPTEPDPPLTIGYSAFEGTGLVAIEIPVRVTSITDYAFLQANSLTSVTFRAPTATDPPLTIGDGAFRYAQSLVAIEIPSRATSIGDYAFQENSALTSLTFASPSSLLTIGEYAFANDAALTTIELPGSITSIKQGAFESAYALTSLTFASPSSLLTIGDGAFRYAQSLVAIEIPTSVTSIGDYAFQENYALASLTFASPSSLLTIGDGAFRYAQSLVAIEIPTSVTSIGDTAFQYNYSLTSLTFASPSSLLTIGNYAFNYAQSLVAIEIPTSVTSIGDNAFQYNYSLTSLTFASPSSLESIGQSAFATAGALTTIEIPASVTDIGGRAFFETYSITSFSVGGGTSFKSVDDALLTYDGARLLAYPASKNSDTYEIPASVTFINSYAFLGAGALTSFSVEGGNSFRAENGVLYNYSWQTLVAYPAGKSLDIYEVPANVIGIGDYAFNNTNALNAVTVSSPSSLRFIGIGAFQYSTVNSIEIPEGVQAIYDDAFRGARLTSVIIPASVAYIGTSAFRGAEFLTTVRFSEGILFSRIRESAFRFTPALTAIEVPPSVTRIDSLAFGDSGLTSISFATSSLLEEIGSDVFNSSTALASITIPASVTNLAAYALRGASGLNTITFLGPVVGQSTYLPPQERGGYTFDGWYSAGDASTRLDQENVLYEAAAATLQARFTSTASHTPAPASAGNSAPAAEAPSQVVDTGLAARTVSAKKKYSAKSLAKQVGVTIVSKKARVSFKIAKTSKKICTKSGAKLKTLKAGNCEVTFTVQEPKPKKGKKPKATKTTTTLVVQ